MPQHPTPNQSTKDPQSFYNTAGFVVTVVLFILIVWRPRFATASPKRAKRQPFRIALGPAHQVRVSTAAVDMPLCASIRCNRCSLDRDLRWRDMSGMRDLPVRHLAAVPLEDCRTRRWRRAVVHIEYCSGILDRLCLITWCRRYSTGRCLESPGRRRQAEARLPAVVVR